MVTNSAMQLLFEQMLDTASFQDTVAWSFTGQTSPI